MRILRFRQRISHFNDTKLIVSKFVSFSISAAQSETRLWTRIWNKLGSRINSLSCWKCLYTFLQWPWSWSCMSMLHVDATLLVDFIMIKTWLLSILVGSWSSSDLNSFNKLIKPSVKHIKFTRLSSLPCMNIWSCLELLHTFFLYPIYLFVNHLYLFSSHLSYFLLHIFHMQL